MKWPSCWSLVLGYLNNYPCFRLLEIVRFGSCRNQVLSAQKIRTHLTHPHLVRRVFYFRAVWMRSEHRAALRDVAKATYDYAHVHAKCGRIGPEVASDPLAPEGPWTLATGGAQRNPWTDVSGRSPGGAPELQRMSSDVIAASTAPHAAFFISLRLTSSSAIWIAFKAAPLRRLSETTHMLRPLSTVLSARMRLM